MTCESKIHLFGHLVHCELETLEEHGENHSWHSFTIFRPNHNVTKITWTDFQ